MCRSDLHRQRQRRCDRVHDHHQRYRPLGGCCRLDATAPDHLHCAGLRDLHPLRLDQGRRRQCIGQLQRHGDYVQLHQAGTVSCRSCPTRSPRRSPDGYSRYLRRRQPVSNPEYSTDGGTTWTCFTTPRPRPLRWGRSALRCGRGPGSCGIIYVADSAQHPGDDPEYRYPRADVTPSDLDGGPVRPDRHQGDLRPTATTRTATPPSPFATSSPPTTVWTAVPAVKDGGAPGDADGVRNQVVVVAPFRPDHRCNLRCGDDLCRRRRLYRRRQLRRCRPTVDAA